MALGIALSASIVFAQEPVQAPIIEEQILSAEEVRMNEIIQYLSWCESRHNPLALNKYDPDTASYGRFQFKWATWKYYIERYGLFAESEEHELWNLIWDGSAQEIVARKILTEGHWKNWYTCLNKYYE